MDTNEYPSLPNLAAQHLRLAANSRRVEAVVNSQLNSIERLFSAATAQDWPTVAVLSKSLSELKPEIVGADVVRAARCVYDELTRTDIESELAATKQPKHLSSLLAACRAARKR